MASYTEADLTFCSQNFLPGPFGGNCAADAPTLMVPKITLGAGETLIQAEITVRVEAGAFGGANGTVSLMNTTNNNCGNNAFAFQGNIEAFVRSPAVAQTVTASADQAGTFVDLAPNQTDTKAISGSGSQCLRVPAGDLPMFVGAGNVLVEYRATSSSNGGSGDCGNLSLVTDVGGRVTCTIEYRICATPSGECPCIRDPRSPASLLLFPEFDNNFGQNTLVTITNANCFNCTSGNLPTEVIVEVVFINRENCLEDNFNVPLTPCDTYTFLTSAQTNLKQGYIYAFAKNTAGQAISFNHLVGQEIRVDGFRNLDWAVNASGFRAIPAQGQSTDADSDGVRDLDNVEYVAAPERIIIPRFLGQDLFPLFFADYRSQLIFIALSGGAQFRTIVDLSIWNDSEECFSAQHEFRCWDKRFLADLSPAFTENFLDLSNDDPLEIIGWTDKEAGWIYIDGRSAFSGIEQIDDPAIYAVLVEEKSGRRVADLPWEEGCQDNGDLLPLGILGDPRLGFPGGRNGDNQ